jgi:DNA polymerase
VGTLLFYDFEVFKYDWLVVVMDSESKSKTVITNDTKHLEKFYNIHKSDIWVGFNSKNYDQFILKGILCGFDPKEVNDYIIINNQPGWTFSQQFKKYPLINYDIMTGIDRGLKVYEGFMGSMIKETSIPFDINRPLTDDEIEETVKYCTHDVEQTIEMFIERYGTFEAKLGLLKMFDLPLSDIGKTDAVLSAKILKANPKKYDDEFEVFFPDCLKVEKYTQVLEWYKSAYADTQKEMLEEKSKIESKLKTAGAARKKQLLKKLDELNILDPEHFKKYFYSRSLNIDVAGVPHVFGWGGLHGAIEKYIGEGYFINIDVTSMYPSIMLVFNLLSRSCNAEEYRQIYENRIKYKQEKNPLQKPLKLVLNTVYGAMRQETNPMYDPRNGALVCVFGQVLLLDLIEKLEEHCQIIQSNTDGILIKLNSYDDFELIDDIVYEWEQRTGLKMEFDEFRKVYQKDVNNYVMIAEDGSYKSKGAYVKKLSRLDYELPIVNKAIIERLVNNIPVEQTINNSKCLKDFQMIVKTSSKYCGLWYGENKLSEKCVRAFASLNKSDKGLFKRKSLHATSEKVAGTPDNCFIVNENVENMGIPDKLDKQWYIDLTNKRLEAFGV